MYNASMLRPLGKCKVQLTNSRDKRKYKVNFPIVEDEHCVNVIWSKTAQQLQLITIRNDKIKPCPEPAECASTENVDVNLTSSREFEGLTLSWNTFSPSTKMFSMALAVWELHCDLKLTKQLNLSRNR